MTRVATRGVRFAESSSFVLLVLGGLPKRIHSWIRGNGEHSQVPNWAITKIAAWNDVVNKLFKISFTSTKLDIYWAHYSGWHLYITDNKSVQGQTSFNFYVHYHWFVWSPTTFSKKTSNGQDRSRLICTRPFVHLHIHMRGFECAVKTRKKLSSV